MTDQVNSPKHYTKGFVETIYAIAEALGPVGFKAFCIGNAIKYYSREGHKNDANEDRAKGDQYLNWAANGLPLPINGFLPRIEKAEPTGANEAYDPRYEEKMARHAEASGQGPAAFDVYAQLAARMFDPNALGAQETARIPSKPEVLGAGYGEQAKAKKTYPRAATVSASLNPAFVKALGYAPTNYFLRVERAQCTEHENHVWYVASIYCKEHNEKVIEMTILNNDPDEEVLGEAGVELAYLFQTYIAN